MTDGWAWTLYGMASAFAFIGWVCLVDWLRELRQKKKECCPTCDFYRGQDSYRCADCEDDAMDGNGYPLWRPQ